MMRRPPPAGGFSLIELLVVIVIVGMMAATALLSIGALRGEDPVEKEARRLTALLGLVSEEALVEGREYGILFELDGYRFLAWDPDSRLWATPEGDQLLRPRTFTPGVNPALAVEGREVELRDPERRERGVEQRDEIVPQVGIFASGELTPFELLLAEESVTEAWMLRGLANGEVELLPPEEIR
jgi:general secretion pathway protein H